MRPADSNALEEIDGLIERDLDEAMARALNHEGPLTGSSAPYWNELADRFRRGAELADALARSASAPYCPGGEA